jgi:hypothetical protein
MFDVLPVTTTGALWGSGVLMGGDPWSSCLDVVDFLDFGVFEAEERPDLLDGDREDFFFGVSGPFFFFFTSSDISNYKNGQ